MTEVVMNLSRRRLAAIEAAWEARGQLDEGQIAFLIRMAGAYLAPVPDPDPSRTGDGAAGGAGDGKGASTGLQGRLKEAVAIVNAGEYRALCALRDAVEGGRAHPSYRSRPRVRRLSRLDRDREVREFILARVAEEEVDKVRQAAIAAFGPARVPSRSSVHGFVRRHRDPETARA